MDQPKCRVFRKRGKWLLALYNRTPVRYRVAMERVCKDPDPVVLWGGTTSRVARSPHVGPFGLPSLTTGLFDSAFGFLVQALDSAERHVQSARSRLFGMAEPPGATRWREKHPDVYTFQPPTLTPGRRAIVEELIGPGKLSGPDNNPPV